MVNRELVRPIDKDSQSDNRQWYAIEPRTAQLIAALLRFEVRVYYRDDQEIFNDLARRLENLADDNRFTGRDIEIELTELSVNAIEEAWDGVCHEFPLSW